ncbi:heterokaryon incompatibility protein-domain-containing protein [Truncatella angustata]|uniref:Heterokaryon incompatibility protein-domain-containing protein n=1 Tax=Truncatella angustata TaxID=152316 RepID=A0A9P9A257_9PEZI|nr:heterokaryon incompatibility protein-domain-containing protein [Truncatella angustata]KAH6659057.1 heterokaryon incompatibility protein-domain-containing protein [Truncatella angustata]
MPKLFSALDDLTKGARVAADTTVWLGRYAKRQYNSGKNGVCLLCNNLQPEGHENTLVWTPSGAKTNNNFSLVGKGSAADGGVPALALEELSTKELLKSREIDKNTGAPVRDCKYCRLLCEIFDAFFIDEWMSWVTETVNAMPVSFGLMIRRGAPLVVTTTGFVHDKYWKEARADVEVYLDPAVLSNHVPGLPALGPAVVRQTDTRSEACMNFVKESVWQCCHEHPGCRTSAQGFKPTRLLYVGGGDAGLRLCETTTWPEAVPYVALSHCWGGSKPLSLKTSQLEDFKKHIDVSELPNTFKDAIMVARELQLPYLWIDSLCIVQDDKTDWEKEAALMADVYSQAFVVVTTASSPNPETPILGPREDEWLSKTFNFPASPGVTVPVIARKRHVLAASLEQGLLEPPFTTSWAWLKRVGPLYNRGWCFQEAYLATRNLQFTPGAIVFECKTHRRSEDQLPPYPSTVPGTISRIDPADQWRMIVRSFTSRQLTFGSDKMPAIGGAARTMPQARTSRYLAGLWSETLLLDLMWQVMPWLVLAVQDSESLAYDDQEGGPPTWSWASMNWGVLWSPLKSPQPVASVLDVQTTVDGLDPYGRVSGGAIKLQGRLKRCQLKSNSRLDHDAFYTQLDGTKCKPQHYRTDGPLSYETTPGPYGVLVRRGRQGPYTNELETTGAVFIISCSPFIGSIGREYVGLVLGTSTRYPGCMERVGAIFALPKHWYDSAEEAVVTIV